MGGQYDQSQVRGSIVVSISACHAEDPGSIPGRGAFAKAAANLARPLKKPIRREALRGSIGRGDNAKAKPPCSMATNPQPGLPNANPR